MKTTFINKLTELMQKNKDIVTITADMGFSVFENLQQVQPKRFINTGVTEQASVSIAAGMALSGYKVFFYAQAAFATMRCFEQLHLDVAYNNLNVKIIGVNAGVSLNQLGVSHFSVEDVAIMRTLPGVTIFTPSTPYEMQWTLDEAYRIDGPVYLRYSKLQAPDQPKSPSLSLGKPSLVKKGSDAILLVSGGILQIAQETVALLEKKDIAIAIYSMPTVKPIDKKSLLTISKNCKIIFTLEEHSVIGGLGSALAEIFAEIPNGPLVKRFGIPDTFIGVTGSARYLLAYNGISPEKLAAEIKKILAKKV